MYVTTMRLLLIYNPRSGHGRAHKKLSQVEGHFQRKQIEVDLRLTSYPAHAVEIVGRADFENYDGLVAAGGDGTLFEVINGYFHNPSRCRIPLGILPLGTGNAFARELDLAASNWAEAIEIISGNKRKKVDVGRFVTQGREYYYLNILGLGFVAEVAATAHRLKLFGNLAYTFGIVYRLVRLEAYPLTLEVDGKLLEQENTFAEISNTRYTSNFLIAPDAKIDDGLLDVVLLRQCSRRTLIRGFPKIFTGEHVHMKEVETFQTRRLRISTVTPKVLTPDGELLGTTPVDIECLPQAIEVFWR